MSSGPPNANWDEIKLIQEKLDKIGDFRFRVKALSITLLTGLLAGGLLLKLPSLSLLLACLPILLCWALEWQQTEWHGAFVRRLSEIDADDRRRKIAKLIESEGAASQAKPGRPDSLMAAVRDRHRTLNKTLLGKVILAADSLFYLGQFALVLIVAILAYYQPERPQRLDIEKPLKVQINTKSSEELPKPK